MADEAPTVTPAGQAPQPANTDRRLWELLTPVLAAIGTGIGVIGFVIFFGGFILWTRFDAAGLPANEAVSQVSRNDLIVTGATFLVPALLAALAAVAVAFVSWDAVTGHRQRSRKRKAEQTQASAADALKKLEEQHGALVQELSSVRVEKQRSREEAERAPAGEEREAALQRKANAESAEIRLDQESHTLETEKLPRARSELAAATEAAGQPTRTTRGDRFVQVLIGGIPMLVTELLIIYAGWGAINTGPNLLLIAVAAATVAVAVAIYSHTESFPLYALAVFLGVGVVTAFSTYERTHAETKVSAFAAIQAGSPITGFFVAETSDAVYFAVPGRKATKALALDHSAITLVRVPKDAISGMTVSPLMKETGAYIRSMQLALSLCKRPKAPAQTTGTTTTTKKKGDSERETRPRVVATQLTVCSASDIGWLKATLAHP